MVTRLWVFVWTFVSLLLLDIVYLGTAETRLVQTLEDEVGADNFSYYRLQRPGVLQLELTSLKGDVDVYISTEVQHPDYNNYDLKSETCGVDIIRIQPNMPRPVYISLFGHPNHLMSRYKLSIFDVDEPIVDDYEVLVDKYERYYYQEMDGGTYDERQTDRKSSPSHEDSSYDGQTAEHEMPLWWKILLSILEFGIEVIL